MEKLFKKKYKPKEIIQIPEMDNVFLVRILRLLEKNEIQKIQNYTDEIFKQIDDNRRRKTFTIKNKNLTKLFTQRYLYKKIIINGKIYSFNDFHEEIEIIKWLKNKPLNEKTFNKITKNKYITNDDDNIYLTYIIGLNTKFPNIKIKNLLTDEIQDTKIYINKINTLIYSHNHYELIHFMDLSEDYTFIYFHLTYKSMV